MALKVIFFDMDGVLVFSEYLHCNAWKALLQAKNIESPDFFKPEKYAGFSDNVIAAELIKNLGLSDSPEILLEEKQRIFLDLLNFEELEVPPGRDQFLNKCRERYQVALVSSSSRSEVEAILKKEKLDSIFTVVITGDDVSSHKPSPEPYLLALQKTGVAAAEALVIEDSANGIASAQAAGIKVITFNGSFEDILMEHRMKLVNRVMLQMTLLQCLGHNF